MISLIRLHKRVNQLTLAKHFCKVLEHGFEVAENST